MQSAKWHCSTWQAKSRWWKTDIIKYDAVKTVIIRTQISRHTVTSLCNTHTRIELGRHSFPVAAPTVWNSLPAHLRSTLIGRRKFRDRLKSHLFADAYFWLGIDRYHAGPRYPILSAAAIPIPMLEMTSPIVCGIHTLRIPYVCFKT